MTWWFSQYMDRKITFVYTIDTALFQFCKYERDWNKLAQLFRLYRCTIIYKYKFFYNVLSNIKSLRLRKSLTQILAASIVIISESGDPRWMGPRVGPRWMGPPPKVVPFTSRAVFFCLQVVTALEENGSGIGSPLSDLITIETAKIFLSRSLLILDLHACY